MGTTFEEEAAYVAASFQSLAEAILPEICKVDSAVVERVAGAVQLGVDRFTSWELDYSLFVPANADPERIPPLSWSTARLLDLASNELIRRSGASLTTGGSVPSPATSPARGAFSALPAAARLEALSLVERLEIPTEGLPPPYAGNPAIVQVMPNSLYQLTMFGYYSEWFGYGSTRLLPPTERRVEWFSPIWKWIGYPGPSYGYRENLGESQLSLYWNPGEKGEDTGG